MRLKNTNVAYGVRAGQSRAGIPILLWALCLVTLLPACSLTKHVPDGEYALQKNKLNLHSDQRITERGTLADELSAMIIQKPNTRFLGVPYKVWLYNIRYKKFSRDTAAATFQLKARMVERPVLYDSSLVNRSKVNMLGYLATEGYFYPVVNDTILTHGKKATALYEVETGYRYHIRDLYLAPTDRRVDSIITSTIAESFIKKGAPFSYTLLQQERNRIATVMRNAGYYNFSANNVFYELDTLLRPVDEQMGALLNIPADRKIRNGHEANLKLIVEDNPEANAFIPYTFSRVTVYPDFRDRSTYRDTTLNRDTVDGLIFRYKRKYVRPRVLLNHIYLESGGRFSQAGYDRTITRLNSLGIFEYVRVNIREDTTTDKPDDLRATILLSPVKRYDLSLGYELSNGSTYTLGNALSLTFYNRNLFRGANQLSLSLSTGLEAGYDTAIGNSTLKHFFILSRNTNFNAALSLPKFLLPFRQRIIGRANFPRTIISAGFNILDRVSFFTLTNARANYTYNWQQNPTLTWDFSPGFVNILSLPYASDSFRRELDKNQFLENSYREVFVEGENLTLTYNSQPAHPLRRAYTFIRASVEEAGGLLTGADALNGSKSLGFNYANYIRLDLDARQFYRLPKSLWAARFLAGIGIPYADNSTLPYIKQYFVGGAYSIRGWRIRSLGPGSFQDTTRNQQSNFIDRTGDIKLEANLEYRFDIIKLFAGSIKLTGAVFADAGNIWLANKSPEYPGGEFRFDTFLQDVAVSSGVGLRLDFGGLFVLRIDTGFPLRRPYAYGKDAWVIRDINLLSSSWRQNNLVLNIAIGYPF